MTLSASTPTPPGIGDKGQLARQTATTLGAGLALQSVTFAILSIAAYVLPIAEFARLSLLVVTAMLSQALFDAGVTITTTKWAADRNDERLYAFAFLVRLGMLGAAALLAVAADIMGARDIAVGLACGAALNLWNGIRGTDQAKQDYGSFARVNIAYAVLRAVAGFAALFVLRDAIMIGLALYVVPLLAAPFSASLRYLRGAWSARSVARPHFWPYAFHVYVTALAFIAIPYVPQYVVEARFGDVEVGTYGLLLTFVAPLGLLVQSLRSVLLPKMVGARHAVEDWMWSRRGVIVIAATWALLVLVGLAGGAVLGEVYGARFAQVAPAFAIFFAGYSGAALIGFYSLSVHTLGVAHVASMIGILRLVVLATLLFWLGDSFLPLVGAVSLTLVATETLQALVLARRRRAA